MLARNWMNPNPVTVSGDTLVSKAKRILLENSLRALPVVDDAGHLRGLLTRVNCLRAAEQVARTEDPHELSYFVNRLRVKDLMVRKPQTISAQDGIEVPLLRGMDEGISQFPVVNDDGTVVGVITAHEIFLLAAQILCVQTRWSGLTLAPRWIKPGLLGQVAAIAEAAGANLQSIFTLALVGQPDLRKIVLRFTTGDLDRITQAVAAAGFEVVEVSSGLGDQSTGHELGLWQ